jgi:hypothetical protein
MRTNQWREWLPTTATRLLCNLVAAFGHPYGAADEFGYKGRDV